MLPAVKKFAKEVTRMICLQRERAQKVMEAMKSQGFSQMLVSSTESVYYLTGLWVEPMERLLALYLNTDGQCVLFGNALFGVTQARGMELQIHTDDDDPVADIAKTVADGPLGVDKDWPSRFLLRLMELRPQVRPMVGSAPVDEARKQKDETERQAMRAASAVNDQVMAQIIGELREGVTEAEMAARVEALFREHGGERSNEGQLVCFGANGADPHHAPVNDTLKPGDSVVLDIFNPIGRYWCDMTRTVFWKEVSEEQRRVYETVKAANLAAEAVIRPGVNLCDVDRAARQVIEEAGYGPYFTHRLGHGCGLSCHEPPDNSASSLAIAQPGMVFSVEPGIYLPGKFGVRIEDLVLVTETGCEVLNHYSKDLQVLE